ncbi:MAG: peptide MFS transporter [Odoribacteraceae bacterium]|jgi:POT family proton-dependent oligopeptide transporter|nr:peptide MFS transporter [Odoribacteraceae bacterium]
MFKQHPKGLLVLALTNMGERFGYYTMLAILALYMQAKFGLSSSQTSFIYGTFLALVYFLPLIGGFIGDKVLGYGRTILLGVVVMFAGYLLLAVPSDANLTGKIMMFGALSLISVGTGFFKGNLQTLVGNLYDSGQYPGKRDVAFSIFYMFINIGAFFAPSAANAINNAFLTRENFTYDASVPKNFVALNDKVVDESTYVMKALEGKVFDNKDPEENEKARKKIIKSAKKRDGVIFASDRDEALFRLKASGLNQLTLSGKITDPAAQLSTADYELLDSRMPEDQPTIAAIKARVKEVSITDPSMHGSIGDPDAFPTNFGGQYVNNALSKSYNVAFGVACISLIVSVLIFLMFKGTWKAADKTHKQQLKEATAVILSKQQVRERVIALLLVFFVVIFFWMSFHQNGLCMTFFARDYTVSKISAVQNMAFSLMGLLPLTAILYGVYLGTMGILGGKRNPLAGGIISLVGLGGLAAYYFVDVQSSGPVVITPQIFQQFNPLFIVILTPVAVALFALLGRRKKEPTPPRKIGYGMLIAAAGFVLLLFASIGQPTPAEIDGTISDKLVSPNWLISTYLVLTLAELFLSPMGLSFVAKVSPPQYKGMMQGGWLAATAVGNLLVGIMGSFWDKLPLYAFWGVLIICCLLSALFIFSIIKRLDKVTA